MKREKHLHNKKDPACGRVLFVIPYAAKQALALFLFFWFIPTLSRKYLLISIKVLSFMRRALI
jgi:hypothetical protein